MRCNFIALAIWYAILKNVGCGSVYSYDLSINNIYTINYKLQYVFEVKFTYLGNNFICLKFIAFSNRLRTFFEHFTQALECLSNKYESQRPIMHAVLRLDFFLNF